MRSPPPHPPPRGYNSDRRSITCTRDVDAVPVHAGAVITLALILFMYQSDYIQKWPRYGISECPQEHIANFSHNFRWVFSALYFCYHA